MSHKPDKELQASQIKIMEAAAIVANQRMRDEVLELCVQAFKDRNEVDIIPQSLEGQKKLWNPLIPNWNAMSGFGMSFRNPEGDPMIQEILRSQEMQELVNTIITDSLQEAMAGDKAVTFISSLLDDLMKDESFYAQSIV